MKWVYMHINELKKSEISNEFWIFKIELMHKQYQRIILTRYVIYFILGAPTLLEVIGYVLIEAILWLKMYSC